MGGGGKQSSSGSGKTTETVLSKEQAAILKSRENQYQQFFFPELVQMLNEQKQPAAMTKDLAPAVDAINTGYQNAQQQVGRDLARRGVADSGVAVAASGALQNARVSSLADAYLKAEQAKEQRRMSLVQMGGAMSPTPTQAAPMGQKSNQSSSGWDFRLAG